MVVSSGSLTATVLVTLRLHGVKVCEKYGVYLTILLLLLLGHCLPIFDEICRRSSNFIHSCIVSKSILVRSVALFGILFGRYSSCIGHNALFFTWYSCTVQDIIEGRVNSIVRSHCNAVFDDYCLDVANCMYELIVVWDNVFKFSDNFHMSSCDLIDIIANLCTC